MPGTDRAKNCHDLVSLDFEQALLSPQQPKHILQCKQTQARKPQWLGPNNIALLQKQSKQWRLINYAIDQNASTDLYRPAEGNLIDYVYSPAKKRLAVSRIHSDGKQYLDMLRPNGELISTHPIQRPPEIPKFRTIYPNFDPLNEQLVFSTSQQLFALSYEGVVTKIKSPFVDRMVQPVFHPDGRRMLMLKGPYDSDMVRLGLDQLGADPPPAYRPFERSTMGEDYAMFQPGGDAIVFWSRRSGAQQLWLWAGDASTQLSDFPIDTSIRGMDWAADGQSVLVNANGQLVQIHLDGRHHTFKMAHAVHQLFQWDSTNNRALLRVRMGGVLEFVEYDLEASGFEVVRDSAVKWALKSRDGRLIYKDQANRFWQPGPIEFEPIAVLDGQGDRADSFVIFDNTIYAINSDDQLWSYDLEAQWFAVLGAVRPEVDDLTDVVVPTSCCPFKWRPRKKWLS